MYNVIFNCNTASLQLTDSRFILLRLAILAAYLVEVYIAATLPTSQRRVTIARLTLTLPHLTILFFVKLIRQQLQ